MKIREIRGAIWADIGLSCLEDLTGLFPIKRRTDSEVVAENDDINFRFYRSTRSRHSYAFNIIVRKMDKDMLALILYGLVACAPEFQAEKLRKSIPNGFNELMTWIHQNPKTYTEGGFQMTLDIPGQLYFTIVLDESVPRPAADNREPLRL